MSVADPVIDYLDLATKHIYLLAGCREYHPVEDIYCEIRTIRRTDESMRVFDQPVSAAGAVPKGGGKYTPRYAIFNHGWRVVPEDASHDLYITGEQITDDGQSGKACLDLTVLSPGTNIFVHYEPPAAEIIRDEESLAAIRHMSFGGMVHIDVDNTSGHAIAGTDWPAGTEEHPSDNVADASVIASERGFYKIHVIGHLTIPAPYVTTRYHFIGQGPSLTTITVEPGVDTTTTRFQNATMTGTFSGKTGMVDCKINGLTNWTGKMRNCFLTEQPVVLAPSGVAQLFWCVGASPSDQLITIDSNHGDCDLIVRDFNGCFRILNQTSSDVETCANFNGYCVLDSTCTAGQFDISGTGKLDDNTTGTPTVLRFKLVHPEDIGDYIWTGKQYVKP